MKAFLVLASLIFTLSIAPDRRVIAYPGSEIDRGIEAYRSGKTNEAIELWQAALLGITEPKQKAIVLNNLALAYRQMGRLSLALTAWQEAIKIYRSENETKLAALLTEQAQVYSDLGQNPKAIPLLEEAIALSQQNQDRLTQAAAEGALGNALAASGEYNKALDAHQISLNLARDLNDYHFIASALNNLGNVYASRQVRQQNQAEFADREGNEREFRRLSHAARKDLDLAKNSFIESAEVAIEPLDKVKALTNLYYLQDKKAGKTVSNWNLVERLLSSVPASRQKAYSLIKLAPNLADRTSAIRTLEEALAISRNLGDIRGESFALGSLGQLYEQYKEYDKAIELTEKAQFAAQKISAADSLYRWQWQAGRILKAKGDKQRAIAAYRGAIATLASIRGDLLAVNQELQFDFRSSVEPIYRSSIELLLELQSASASNNTLSEVIETLELLKIAELENFFGDECVEVSERPVSLDTLLQQSNSAVVYSIILDDRLELILRSPDGSLTNYSVAIAKEELEQQVNQLRYYLEYRATEQYLPHAQKVYDLLIRPLEKDLANINPSTVVWINDGVLRNIPMAALYDDKEFLIQKYALATTPSLNLTTSQTLDRSRLQALTVGLTVARPPFAALSNVKDEVDAVKEILGGKELLDEGFTLTNLETQLTKKNYNIVHIATHGKFGVDGKSTFLVGFDRRIGIDNLDNLLRSRPNNEPVELLTLSACQTAAGDDRAALGIAGVAVRAGVESSVATLWYINDRATVPLIEEFYQQLRQPGITKAEALRKAQIKAIDDINYTHPGVWSPFILIGNWL
jgi:CHAT domain-containing protein